MESKHSFSLVSRLKDLSGYDFDIPVNIENIEIAKFVKTKKVLSGETWRCFNRLVVKLRDVLSKAWLFFV